MSRLPDAIFAATEKWGNVRGRQFQSWNWFAEQPPTKQAQHGPLDFTDHTGKQFGRLMVVGQLATVGRGHAFWVCQCNCGAYCLRTTATVTKGARCGRCLADLMKRLADK